MRDFILAVAAATLFAACVYVSYDFGFGHGVEAAREACGNVVIQMSVEAGASLEVIKTLVDTICYGK